MNTGLREGMPVYDMAGKELGTVKEVRGDEVKIDAPMQPDYWVRADAFRSGADGRLVLMDEADRYEATAETRGDATMGTQTRRSEVEETDVETLQLREERLRVSTEREQAGEVRLGKQVTEHTETVAVPLREERVVIERHPVNERVAGGQISDTDQTIEVPVERERAVAEKEAVVTEEVGVRKEAVERTQQVQGTVRKEELVVEGEGDVVESGRNPNAPPTETYERERSRRE
jgi:uncharacterized protein (TIGR02271 family)